MYKEITSNWFKATKIGDFMEGTLVSKEWKETSYAGETKKQEVYEILCDDGKFHSVIKEGGFPKIDEENPTIIEKGEYYKFAKSSIVDAMKKIKVGQKVKLIFDSVVESKDKMKQDFKLVKVYGGPMDTSYQYEEVNVDQQMNALKEAGMDVENIPFD